MFKKRPYEIDYDETLKALPKLGEDFREIKNNRLKAFNQQIEQNREILESCIVTPDQQGRPRR